MKKIGVLGTGTMGAGIIQVLAQNGYEVVLRARRQTSVDNGIATVTKNLDKMVKKEKITEEQKNEILSRVHGSTDIEIVKDADLIIEAATENMEAKKALFKELDELVKPEAIIATNTSSLSITEIAAATNRPDKIIGMHFFNPVPAMKLVEIIKGLATSEETKNTILELTAALKKTPVEVEEAPGFVVNRILIPMINEGIGILADGVADAEGIDAAMAANADIVVLCSSDDEYAEYAIPAYKYLNNRAIFVVAGAPACSEDLKAAGIENFIHVKVNQLETLKNFNAKLGI